MPWSCYSFFGRNMAIFSLSRFTLLASCTGFDQSPYLRVHAVPIHSSRNRFLHPVLARMLQVVMVPCEHLCLKAVRNDKPRTTIVDLLDEHLRIIEDVNLKVIPLGGIAELFSPLLVFSLFFRDLVDRNGIHTVLGV